MSLEEKQGFHVKNIYITKWADENEMYVRYDDNKDEFTKVKLGKAQHFGSRKDAEEFAEKMAASGFKKPEIVPVDVQPFA